MSKDKDVRQRAMARGVGELSDVELLSLVVSPAKRGEEAVEVAERVVAEVDGSLVALAHRSPAELRKVGDLGLEGATKVAAAFELGRRAVVAEGQESVVIKDAADVVKLLAPVVGGLDHEELWVLYLASSNRVVERRRVAVGGSRALVADPKLILKRAVELVSASIILVHNHPSGVAEPSVEDCSLTDRLRSAAALFDIALLDHIIICKGGFYSFRAGGKL